MIMLETYIRRCHRFGRQILAEEKNRKPLQITALVFLGFCLSAASLGNHAQPIAMAVLCAGLPGWMPIAFALGGTVGYWVFWGSAGAQCIFWMAASLPVCLVTGGGKMRKILPLLGPMLASAIVAICGVIFQIWWQEELPILLYLLRIAVAFATAAVTLAVRNRRDTAADWVAIAILVLALAQVAPAPFLGLGFLVGGMMVGSMPFPAVALAGLALDLAQVTPVPMTAVLCLASSLRLLPKLPAGWCVAAPAIAYMIVMGLCTLWDFYPVPALLVGGAAGLFLPGQPTRRHRRGETGFAQVRLEMAAAVLTHSETLLLEAENGPVDHLALTGQAIERACGTCPVRKGCRYYSEKMPLPEDILRRPQIRLDDMPSDCKKRNRLMLELRRNQDRYRNMQADRDRQQEYRGAVIQQYRFLAEFLQDLADQLPARGETAPPRFQPEVAVCSSGKELANGDRCLWFAGTENRYYLLLCDGMGTGPGAAAEARAAGDMLRRLLMAGYPAAYALRSINSLCTLRMRAGAVTMDLAQVHLDTGKVMLYKWGAAPSWLLTPSGAEQIGKSAPPPGISVEDCTETVERLSLRHGQMLVLVSDGVDPEAVAQQIDLLSDEPPGSLAAKLLEAGRMGGTDDTTAAVLRLTPIRPENA